MLVIYNRISVKKKHVWCLGKKTEFDWLMLIIIVVSKRGKNTVATWKYEL